MAGNETVDKVKGVFSTQEIKKIGTGTTTKRTVQKNFWFVETLADGRLECQPLNSNFVPSGPKRMITMDELIEKFAPEPEFYMSSVFPKMMELKKNIESGDEHRNKGENFAAEHEYSAALQIDEDNVRANFGIGLTYMKRGESDRAQDIFERLLNLEGSYAPEHKHLFNEFGINLRKTKMFTQAVEYYERALTITDTDEGIHINLARTLLEKKDFTKCTEHLIEALRIAPGHESANKFLEWLMAKNYIPAELHTKSKDALAGKLAAKPKPKQATASESEAKVEQPQVNAASIDPETINLG